MFMILAGLAFISGIIILANLYQAGRFKNRIALNGLYLLLATMIVIFGGLVVRLAFASTQPLSSSNEALVIYDVSIEASLALFCVSLLFGFISSGLIFSRKLRVFVQRYIVRSDGYERRDHADSVVHTLALILMLFAIVFTVSNFIIAGGIEGLAEEIADIGVIDLLGNFLIYVVLALFGVGVFVRRNIPRTLKRLGIRLPEKGKFVVWLGNAVKHLIIGATVGFGMFWIQAGLSLIWQLLSSPETIAAQSAASQALFAAFSGSLWLGFLVAITAGVGEELLFRGALQPIFGNLIVSIFFVMMHSQYILTPASLIILLVSIIFGFLRSRYTTPTAMMAHFVYNFTPFVLIAVLTQLGIPLEGFIF